MASFIYNSCLYDMARARINFDVDVFHILLVSEAYIPDKRRHTKRSDIKAEVIGEGYARGGVEVVMSVDLIKGGDGIEMMLGSAKLPGAKFAARRAIYCKWRGGDPSLDELVACNDFGRNFIPSGGVFSLTKTILGIDNTGLQ